MTEITFLDSFGNAPFAAACCSLIQAPDKSPSSLLRINQTNSIWNEFKIHETDLTLFLRTLADLPDDALPLSGYSDHSLPFHWEFNSKSGTSLHLVIYPSSEEERIVLLHTRPETFHPPSAPVNEWIGHFHDTFRSLRQKARNLSMHPDRMLDDITLTLSGILRVERVNIWEYKQEQKTLHCLSFYDHSTGLHSRGQILDTNAMGDYIEELEKTGTLLIDAGSSNSFLENYLKTHNISSLLDSAIYDHNSLRGVVCLEHTNTPRIWTDQEISFSASIATLVSELLTGQQRLFAESRLQAILDAIPDTMFVFDKDTRFLDCHTPDESNLLLNPSEFIGKKANEVLPSFLADLTFRNVNKVLAQNTLQTDTYYLEVRGQEKHYEVRYAQCGSEEVLAIVRDNTNAVNTEKEKTRLERLQKLILQIALEYIHIQPEDQDEQIQRVLTLLGGETGSDRVYVFRYDFEAGIMINTHEWCADGIPQEIDNLRAVPCELFPEWVHTHVSGNNLVVENVQNLPEGSNLRAILEPQGIKTLVTVPILQDQDCVGFIGFDNNTSCRTWSNLEISMLKVVAQIIVHASQHRQYERTLRDSANRYRELQELFRKIADNMPDMLWVKDIEKNFIFTNQSICENLLNAKNTEEPIGKNDLFFAERERQSHPENPRYHTFGEVCRDSDQVIIDTQTTGRFNEFGNVKGKFLYLDVIKSPMFDEKGNLTAIIGSARDITQQKRTELIKNIQFRVLQKSTENPEISELFETVRQELGLLFDTTNFYLALFDESTGILTAPYEKDQYDKISKWPAEKSCTGLVVLNNKSCLMTDHEVRELINQGQLNDIGTPSKCWMGVPLRLGSKVLGAFVVQSYENDKAYTAEDMEVMENLSNHLSLAIHRSAIETKRREALHKAQESDRLKMAFLENMSHEIRTPLNGILGFTSMLLEDEPDPENVKNYARVIDQSGTRLLHLLNDIIDISKLDSGAEDTERIPCQPSALLVESLSYHQRDIQNKRIEFRIQIPDNCKDLTILSDPGKITRILGNLVNNAIKFTPKGWIEAGIKKNDNEVWLYVQDSGIGIEPEYHNKIFERFYQIDNNYNRGHEGPGLGLSISKGLIDLLGGKIWLESAAGQGSTFWISLPLTGSFSGDKPRRQTREWKQTNNNRKILITEDDLSNFDYLKILLSREGFQILHAWTGLEAVQTIKANPDIALVFMDLKLTVMDGYQATREIKSHYPDLPVIALTAFALSGDKAKAISAGCDEYITKPVEAKKILETVNRYILIQR